MNFSIFFNLSLCATTVSNVSINNSHSKESPEKKFTYFCYFICTFASINIWIPNFDFLTCDTIIVSVKSVSTTTNLCIFIFKFSVEHFLSDIVSINTFEEFNSFFRIVSLWFAEKSFTRLNSMITWNIWYLSMNLYATPIQQYRNLKQCLNS